MSNLNLINSCDDPIRVREEYVANSTYGIRGTFATHLLNDTQNRTFRLANPREWTGSNVWINTDTITNESISANKVQIRGQPEEIRYWDEIFDSQKAKLDEIYKVRALKAYEEEMKSKKAIETNPFTGRIPVDHVKLKIQIEPDPASIPFKPSLPPPSPQLELF